jgi:hypothetical protein
MLQGLGVEPTGNSLDGALLDDLFRNRKAPPESCPSRPAHDCGAGQYICIRGTLARRVIAATNGRHDRRRAGKDQRTDSEACGSDPVRHCRCNRRRRLLPLEIMCIRMDRLAISSIPFPSTTAKAAPVRNRAATGISSVSFRAGAPLSTARSASVRRTAIHTGGISIDGLRNNHR